ncbi:21 kDa protein [Morella rubra]|uniref:21 kDa protein n=1 Tax=Morella rubra TaxID=262757 RepID=A0A6A1VG59_9ROSI|nr:21 kDa protein [Morella rubra]
MAKVSHLLLLLSVVCIAATAKSAATKSGGATNFIKNSCSATNYPTVCVQSLSPYASKIQQNQRQLVQTALSVSLANAQSTKGFVSKLGRSKGLKAREYAAIKDCLEEIGDTVDRLSQSVQELKLHGQGKGRDFQWHMSNVETWVSAALTDENTCVDGFSGRALDGKIKASVKGRVVNLAQVVSNALALVNRYAKKH